MFSFGEEHSQKSNTASLFFRAKKKSKGDGARVQ